MYMCTSSTQSLIYRVYLSIICYICSYTCTERESLFSYTVRHVLQVDIIVFDDLSKERKSPGITFTYYFSFNPARQYTMSKCVTGYLNSLEKRRLHICIAHYTNVINQILHTHICKRIYMKYD